MKVCKILFGGDVMTGRGIDQVMVRPCAPELYESHIRDARDYVQFAETAHGPIPSAVGPDYIWGDALEEIERLGPDVRIFNLETAVTDAGSPFPGKGIHYRMNPANISCLAAARIDACTLANNHVLDWGDEGFSDTLSSLRHAGFATAGAGRNHVEAAAPAVLPLRDGRRLLVFAFATDDCGVPPAWEANHCPGINMLPADDAGLEGAVARIVQLRHDDDIVVVSIHWGANWVDCVPEDHRRIARRFIDAGAADVIHGHSSHHPLPAEVYRGKLVLYGCGDLINDYEGIDTGENARCDLVCLYLATIESGGRLRDLDVLPFQLHRFRLRTPGHDDREWLRKFINGMGSPLGTKLATGSRRHWHLAWHEGA